MKAYSFSKITVRPFPTLSDLSNKWIIDGVQVIINVSERDYTTQERQLLQEKGIDIHWLPLVEEGPDMGLENIKKAISILKDCDAGGKNVLLHCDYGNNRSKTVAELFYLEKTGLLFEDEYKGYGNHFLYNIAQGHLPALKELSSILLDL